MPTETNDVVTQTADQGLDARRLASEIIAACDEGALLDASAVLQAHPELAGHKSIVLDLAHEEYCQRIERGERIDPDEFATRFPDYHTSLLRLIELQQLVNEDVQTLLRLQQEVRWPEPGERYLDFQLIELIGHGAFSRVFLATEPALGDRRVVLKVTRSMLGEAHLLGRLQHPRIVPVFSVRSDASQGLHAICMPFLGRATLYDVIDAAFRDGKMPVSRQVVGDAVRKANGIESGGSAATSRHTGSYVDAVLEIGMQLCDALSYTHGLGVFHGDIKPSNVLLKSSGEALLFDFNLAFRREGPLSGRGGTLPYMSPEQLADLNKPAESDPPDSGEASDVFSLGVTLYELLCGRLPFGQIPQGLSREELVEELLGRQRAGAAPLRSHNPSVHKSVADAVESCLAFDAADRTATAQAVRESLGRQLRWPQRVRRWHHVNRRKSLAMMAGGVCALASGAVAWARRDPFADREIGLAWQDVHAEDYAAALGHFENVLSRNNENLEALYGRGRVYLRRQQFPAAASEFERCRLKSEDGRIAACLAYALQPGSKHPYRVAALYEDAIEAGFDNAAVQCNLGVAYAKLAKLDEAYEHLSASWQSGTQLPSCLLALVEYAIQRAAQRRQAPDGKWLKLAQTRLPDSIELSLLAAAHYDACALYAGESTAREQSLGRAYAFAEAAIKHGAGRAAIEQAHLRGMAAEQERYRNLLERAGDGSKAESLVYIVDPLGGEDGPLFS